MNGHNFFGPQDDLEIEPRRSNVVGSRFASQMSAPDQSVQALIRQNNRIPVELVFQAFASQLTVHAADFKDVGKVGVDHDVERNDQARCAMVFKPKFLEALVVPEKLRTQQVQAAAGNHHLIQPGDIKVGE